MYRFSSSGGKGEVYEVTRIIWLSESDFLGDALGGRPILCIEVDRKSHLLHLDSIRKCFGEMGKLLQGLFEHPELAISVSVGKDFVE